MKRVFTFTLISKRSAEFLPRLGGLCLFLFTGSLVHARQRAVSGVVRDDGGQPLWVAATSVKFPSNGVTSDTMEHILRTLLYIKEN